TDGYPFGGCDDSTVAACDVCDAELCTPSETQCSGDVLETCVADTNSCGVWQSTSNCGATAGGQGTCDDSGSPAVCDDPCAGVSNLCSNQNAERCDTTDTWQIQACLPDAGQNSCLVWQDTTDCRGNTPPGIGDQFAFCKPQTGAAYTCDTPEGCLVDQPSVAFDPPQIMLVLDKSGSMSQSSGFYDHDNNAGTPNVSRWYGLHVALTSVLNTYDGLVDFGVYLFPTCGDQCVAADPQVGVGPNNGGAILTAIPA